MKQQEIETFLMIVKTKNITKTAENLFLSQPTVSHRLKCLEEELNVRLLTRKKGYKQIELTPQGEEFVPIAERWLSLWQEMQQIQHGTERLYLNIGCTDTLNTAILFSLYREILDEGQNGMNLKITTNYSYEIYELLENHEIDLGFVYHHLHFKNIVAEPILREKMYLVQAINGENSAQTDTHSMQRVHTEALDPEQEIFLSWEANYQIWHDQWVGKGKRPRMQVDTFELLLQLLTDSARWTIAPDSVAKRLAMLCRVRISEIANKAQPPERITYKIRHKYPNEATLKAVRLFEDKLSRYLETHAEAAFPGIESKAVSPVTR